MVWELHRALYGLRTSPKTWQEHLHSTLKGMHLHQLKSDRRVWAKMNIIVLAYVDDLLIPLCFLGQRICRPPNGDSTTRLTSGCRSTSHLSQSCWYAHLGSTSTSRPSVYTQRPHSTSPVEWDWQYLKHTPRYIKGAMHYKFLISPRVPQGHSLPLRQLIPLHINTYCGSD